MVDEYDEAMARAIAFLGTWKDMDGVRKGVFGRGIPFFEVRTPVFRRIREEEGYPPTADVHLRASFGLKLMFFRRKLSNCLFLPMEESFFEL